MSEICTLQCGMLVAAPFIFLLFYLSRRMLQAPSFVVYSLQDDGVASHRQLKQ